MLVAASLISLLAGHPPEGVKKITHFISQVAQRVLTSLSPLTTRAIDPRRVNERISPDLLIPNPGPVLAPLELARLSADREPRQLELELLHTEAVIYASPQCCPGARYFKMGRRLYPICRYAHLRENCIGVSAFQLSRLQTELSCPGYPLRTAMCTPFSDPPACRPSEIRIEVLCTGQRRVLCQSAVTMSLREKLFLLSFLKGLFFISSGSRIPVSDYLELSVVVIDRNNDHPQVLLPDELPQDCQVRVTGDCISTFSVPLTNHEMTIHLKILHQEGTCPLQDLQDLFQLVQETRTIVSELQSVSHSIGLVAPSEGFWKKDEIIILPLNTWRCVLKVGEISLGGRSYSHVICSPVPPTFMLEEEAIIDLPPQVGLVSTTSILMQISILHNQPGIVTLSSRYSMYPYLQIGDSCYQVNCNATVPDNVIGISAWQLGRLSKALNCSAKQITEALCFLRSEIDISTPRRIEIEGKGEQILCFKQPGVAYQAVLSCLQAHVLTSSESVISFNPSTTLQVKVELPVLSMSTFYFRLPEECPPLNLLFSGKITDLTSQAVTSSEGAVVTLALLSQSDYCSLSSAQDLYQLVQRSRVVIPELLIPDRASCYAPEEAFWIQGHAIKLSHREQGGERWECELQVVKIEKGGQSYEWAVCCPEAAQITLPQELLNMFSETLTYFT